MNVAIIPARGGSQRIPRKNIKLFAGKPIIAYSLKAARQSDLFDRIIVSTDDDEIAQVAREWGGETPFKRPSELSDDYTGTDAVTLHAVEWLIEQQSQHPDFVCCIYPTAPLIRIDDLIRGYHLVKENLSASRFRLLPIHTQFIKV